MIYSCGGGGQREVFISGAALEKKYWYISYLYLIKDLRLVLDGPT